MMIRIYAGVTLIVFLWAWQATGHATMNNLVMSGFLAAPLALVVVLPVLLWRLAFGRKGGTRAGGNGLDKVLFTFPTGDAFRLRHLLTSINIWGIIGSGKSSSSGLFLARRILRINSGGLILASNPDDVAWWTARFQEAGRPDDLIVFSKDGPHRWNFLAELQKGGANAADLTSFLVSAAETLSEAKGKEELYWKQLSERLLYNVISALMLAGKTVSPVTIGNFLATAAYSVPMLASDAYQKGFCNEVLQLAKANALGPLKAGDFAILQNYWLMTFLFMDERPRSSALSAVENIIHSLSVGYARELFSASTTVSCEAMTEGKWLLLDFPVSAEGVTGKLIYGCAKLATQLQVLKNKWTPDMPVTVIWADEAWHCANQKDRDFLAESRKHGGVLVYLTQSLTNYHIAMGGDDAGLTRAKSFVGMMGTLIVHAADISTSDYMVELIGEAEQDETGGNYQPETELEGKVTNPASWSSSVQRRRLKIMTSRQFTSGLRMGGQSKVADAWVYRPELFSTGESIQLMAFHQD